MQKSMSPLLELPISPHSSIDMMMVTKGEMVLTKPNKHQYQYRQIWFQISSYTTSATYYKLFIFLLMTVAIAFEWFVVEFDDWFDNIIQGAWWITSYIIFYKLQCNLKNVSFLDNNFNKNEYYLSLGFPILILSGLRFIVRSIGYFCTTQSVTDVIASIGAFAVNLITMYSLNFVILYLSLQIVYKYDELIAKIENTKNIHINEVMEAFDDISKDIASCKDKWEFIVSVSAVYHIFAALLLGFVWITDISNDVWVYCNNDDDFKSASMMLTRFCVRMFALIYGILRMNHKPQKLAKAVNKYCNWKDEKQQFQIQRLINDLIHFDERFKVIGIGIQWKHFTGMILSAIALSAGIALRAKFG